MNSARKDLLIVGYLLLVLGVAVTIALINTYGLGPPGDPYATRSMRVMVPNRISFSPGIFANHGFEPNASPENVLRGAVWGRGQGASSGLSVQFEVQENLTSSLDTLKEGGVGIIACALQELPLLKHLLKEDENTPDSPKIVAFFLAGWSNGDHSIVTRGRLDAGQDLNERHFLFRKNTVSHVFLRTELRAPPRKVTNIAVSGREGIYDTFIDKKGRGDPDAAVLWGPEVARAEADRNLIYVLCTSRRPDPTNVAREH